MYVVKSCSDFCFCLFLVIFFSRITFKITLRLEECYHLIVIECRYRMIVQWIYNINALKPTFILSIKIELMESTKSISIDNNSRVYEWFSCCFPAADCTGVAELRLHQTRPQDDLSPGRGGPPQRVEEIPAPVRRQRRGRRRPQVTSCLFDLLICRFIDC